MFMKRFQCDGLLSQQTRLRIPCVGHQKRERDRTDCWSFYPLLSLYRMGVAERDGQKPREREVVVVVGEFND